MRKSFNFFNMRCKHCKTVFKSIRFNFKYCLSSEECIKSWNIERKSCEVKAWNKEKKVRKEKLLTVQEYIKTVQKTFNSFIRLRDKGSVCISCQKPINGVRHASHYISAGTHWSVRFNEDNVWVSCYKCNVMLSGNQLEYRKELIKKIGLERVEAVELESSKIRKFTIDELKEINEHYKLKIKNKEA